MDEKNPKHRIMNPVDAPPAKRTYIVIGIGRSGTSFVASVLAYLGIFLGDETTRRTLEDQRLARPIEADDEEATKAVIEDYNARHDIWAFKRPSMVIRAQRNEPFIRNPHYIFTHRDYFALALRNEIAMGREIDFSLTKATIDSKHVYNLLRTTTAPSLHLSFELLNADPIRAGELIRDFVHPEHAGQPIDRPAFEAFMAMRQEQYLSP